jgi:hypothetical protein
LLGHLSSFSFFFWRAPKPILDNLMGGGNKKQLDLY